MYEEAIAAFNLCGRGSDWFFRRLLGDDKKGICLVAKKLLFLMVFYDFSGVYRKGCI